MVTIKVGPTFEEFVIYKKILCSASPYYAAMFNVGMVKAGSQVAEEKEVGFVAFELFFTWLYSGSITQDLTAVLSSSVDTDRARIAFYVFADKAMLTDTSRASSWRQSSIFITKTPEPLARNCSVQMLCSSPWQILLEMIPCGSESSTLPVVTS